MDRFKPLREELHILVLLIVMVGMLFFYKPILGGVGLLIAIVIMADILAKQKTRLEQEKTLIRDLQSDFDSAAQDAIFNMPFPLILTDDQGIIKWYNQEFYRLIDDKSVVGEDIKEVLPTIDLEGLDDTLNKRDITIDTNNFVLYNNKVEKSSGENINLFYFVDDSKYQKMEEFSKNHQIGFGHVYIDNYDEIGLGRKGYVKSLTVSKVDTHIMDYFSKMGAIVRKFDDDKYLIIYNRESLKLMMNDRFSILDRVRETEDKDTEVVTLSMGLSDTLYNIQEAYEESRVAIDLALSRGGDQTVVSTEDGQQFFGGTTQAREKRNRVRARVIGNTLKTLIETHENIFIFGHKNADMDAIGSAIGMLGAVRRQNKEAYIVLNEINPSISIIMSAFKEEEPENYERVITTEEALDMADFKKSMIILLDNHSRDFAEAPELIDAIETVVIIDHHRKTVGAIEDPILSYIEPYASSTAELITEILEFIEPGRELSTFQAEALMAGIVVDTKNFSFQTGVRTFEAASRLRRSGANVTEVMRYFEDNYETAKMRAKVIEGSELIGGEITIGILDDISDVSILVAAQAADELLRIQGVNASFVISRTPEYIHISGRSTGEVSVQLILEKLGGGGHLVSAATQLYDVDIEEARQMLEEAIDEYYIEMKEKEDESNTN